MNFFKVKRFRLNQKLKVEGIDPETNQMRVDEFEIESMESGQKVGAGDGGVEKEDYDDEDDDIVSNEMRKSNLEEEETSSSERRESEVEDGYLLSDFGTLYIRYCERMLFFDKLIAQNMKEAGIL